MLVCDRYVSCFESCWLARVGSHHQKRGQSMANTRTDSVQDLSTPRTTASQPPGRSRRLQPQRQTAAGVQRYEMDRWFDRAVHGYPTQQNDPFGSLARSFSGSGLWAPRIEAFQRGDEFIVRAELPGLKKEDVRVNVTDDSIVIEGERRDEFENTHGDVYHTERSYGSFYREVPLPEGAISDKADASFKNGVLEVKLKAPPSEVRRGRSVDIKEG
jgi:HSP20 family molecular chaperone IbpA